VGQVFGSRSAPSFFSLISDICADLATIGTLVENYPLHPMATSIQLPVPPDLSALIPALGDTINTPLIPEEQEIFANASFVDGNGICATADNIIPALHQSLISAFMIYGWPDTDRRSSYMSDSEWDAMATYIVLYLGYYIDSRAMVVTWPLYK
jgi:hypothetical protein